MESTRKGTKALATVNHTHHRVVLVAPANKNNRIELTGRHRGLIEFMWDSMHLHKMDDR